MASISGQELSAVDTVVSFSCLEAQNSAPATCTVIQDHEPLERAAVCYIDKLPDELWVEIFARLRLWDRVRAATVCHRWRNSSLGSPRWLWSVIPTSRGPEACTFFLKRAQRVPVTFRAQLRPDNIAPFCDAIKAHLHHMRVVDLTIPTGSLDERRPSIAGQMHRCLSGALQGPAPMLDIFRVVNVDGWLPMDLGPLPSLDNHVLRTIKLSGLGLSCLTSCAGASNVRSLVIAALDFHRKFTQEDWSLLCSFPALDSLALKLTSPTTLQTLGSPFPPTVKRLSLELSCALFRRLSDLERFARLDVLRILFDDRPHNTADIEAVLPLFRNFVPVSGAVRFDELLLDIMSVDASGRQRILQGVKCDRAWCLPFAQATRLSISGLAHLPSAVTHAPSALPALEELTLDMSRCHGECNSHWHQCPQLACPNLRAMHVRSTRTIADIQLRLLSDFLKDSPGKLATLVLDRVRVFAPPRVDIGASLSDLADTVSRLDTGAIWPECYSAWGTSWAEIMR